MTVEGGTTASRAIAGFEAFVDDGKRRFDMGWRWLRRSGPAGLWAAVVPFAMLSVAYVSRWGILLIGLCAIFSLLAAIVSLAGSRTQRRRAERFYAIGVAERPKAVATMASSQAWLFIGYAWAWAGAGFGLAVAGRWFLGNTQFGFLLPGLLLGVAAASVAGLVGLERTVFWLAAARQKHLMMRPGWEAGRCGFDAAERLAVAVRHADPRLASALATSGSRARPSLRLDGFGTWPGRSFSRETKARLSGALGYAVLGLAAALLALLLTTTTPVGNLARDAFQPLDAMLDQIVPETPEESPAPENSPPPGGADDDQPDDNGEGDDEDDGGEGDGGEADASSDPGDSQSSPDEGGGPQGNSPNQKQNSEGDSQRGDGDADQSDGAGDEGEGSSPGKDSAPQGKDGGPEGEAVEGSYGANEPAKGEQSPSNVDGAGADPSDTDNDQANSGPGDQPTSDNGGEGAPNQPDEGHGEQPSPADQQGREPAAPGGDDEQGQPGESPGEANPQSNTPGGADGGEGQRQPGDGSADQPDPAPAPGDGDGGEPAETAGPVDGTDPRPEAGQGPGQGQPTDGEADTGPQPGPAGGDGEPSDEGSAPAAVREVEGSEVIGETTPVRTTEEAQDQGSLLQIQSPDNGGEVTLLDGLSISGPLFADPGAKAAETMDLHVQQESSTTPSRSHVPRQVVPAWMEELLRGNLDR